MPAAGPEGSRPLPDLPVPRPEHPRPDFRRPVWQNLNGAWDFRFDPEDRGQREHWERSGVVFPDTILVPFPWESPAAWRQAGAGDDRTFYHEKALREPPLAPGDPVVDGEWRRQHAAAPRQEIGWYRRRFTLPNAWRCPGQRVFLCVGAADWEAQVYCNGLPAGSHEGGYDPFAVELTALLGPVGGEDSVTVRVRDPKDNREQPGGKQHGWYERTSGIWQTVHLECRPEVHLTHLAVTPDVPGKRAVVEVGVCPLAGDHTVRVTARSPHGELYTAAVICPGCERRTLDLPLGPHPDLWSPERPQLYDLTVEVAAPAAGPEAVDTVHGYFGMRAVAVGTLPGTDTPCLLLNGQPFYVRSALHQSFHPAGVTAYVRDDIIADDLRAAKAAGLNALRVHIKIDDPRLYYWADRLGVAILYDFPNTAVQSPRARQLWEQTLRAGLARDAGHPSIVLWVLFNETWGLGRDYKRDADTQAWVASMVDLCRRLDPSRPVEDNSACNYDHVETDVNTWHFYINDYERARAHVADAVARTHPGSDWNFVPGRVQGNQPLLNSEYGGIGAGDGDRDVSHCLWWLTANMRLHREITGYVYTELTDVEWEHNGLVRYDRLPKHFPYDLRDVLGADVLIVDGPPLWEAEPGGTLSLPVLISVFSGLPDGTGRLRWALSGWDRHGRAGGGAQGEDTVSWKAWDVTGLATLEIPVPEEAGLYRVDLELLDAAGRRVCGTWAHLRAGAPGGGLPALRADGFHAVHALGDHYWVGEGAGTVRCQLRRAGEVLTLEAAAGVPQPRQTDAHQTPSRITVRADGRTLGTFLLPDAPADARGVLSYANGIPGAYGYLLRLPLPPGGSAVAIEIESGVGGVALFGTGAGAYPVGLDTGL